MEILNRFKNIFTGRFLGKLAVKWISKIPPHLAYVATLPCETLMSAKQAIIDILGLHIEGLVGLLTKLKQVY